MKITYVTQDTELWGGIAVVFQHLELLSEAGHDAFLTTPTGKPGWYPLKVPIHPIRELDPSLIPSADIVVATSWTTVMPVVRSGKGTAVHLCQGYEGDYKEYAHLKTAIDEAYSCRIPKLTVSRHLNRFLEERFGAETYYVGQALNRDIFHPSRAASRGSFARSRLNPFAAFRRKTLKVLVVGPFDVDFKNIATALRGVLLARERYKIPLRLIRVSQFPLSGDEERLIRPDEYHCHVPYSSMGKLYRSADLFVSTSRDAEGFGLPALEAMASGIPTILSTISSYTSFDDPQDYALFVKPEDHEAVAKAISELVHNASLREKLVRRGLEIAGQFTEAKVLTGLIAAFENILHQEEA
jgi:glycosyltransferase involved in cell wall biosynthesis